MAIKKLVIRSNDVEDWNGIYWKGEIEREMKELDNKPEGNEWISWILGHVFDGPELTAQIESFIVDCDALTTVTFRFDDGEVTIEKV